MVWAVDGLSMWQDLSFASFSTNIPQITSDPVVLDQPNDPVGWCLFTFALYIHPFHSLLLTCVWLDCSRLTLLCLHNHFHSEHTAMWCVTKVHSLIDFPKQIVVVAVWLWKSYLAKSPACYSTEFYWPEAPLPPTSRPRARTSPASISVLHCRLLYFSPTFISANPRGLQAPSYPHRKYTWQDWGMELRKSVDVAFLDSTVVYSMCVIGLSLELHVSRNINRWDVSSKCKDPRDASSGNTGRFICCLAGWWELKSAEHTWLADGQ